MSSANQQNFNAKWSTFTTDFNTLTGNIIINQKSNPAIRITETDKNKISQDIRNINSSNVLSIPDYNTIMNTYNSNLALRTKLDEQLQEIYGAPGSINDIFTQQYDATMYMSIVWSVLATSLLYFVFIKL